jgi:hypothetical protein
VVIELAEQFNATYSHTAATGEVEAMFDVVAEAIGGEAWAAPKEEHGRDAVRLCRSDGCQDE